MPLIHRPALAGLLAVLATCCAPLPPLLPQEAPAPRGPAGLHPEVRELVRLVNEHRTRVGCPPLRWHVGVAEVAQSHSDDMARRGFFGHVNPDGDDAFDRLRAAGITYRRAGENLAAGHATARATLEGWLRSEGHRANLERCAYTHHGIGWAENRWTHVLVAQPSPR